MAHREHPDAGAGWRRFVLDGATAPATSLPAAPMVTGVAPASFSAGPQLQPQYDAIEALPPAAADKVRALRVRAADRHRLIPPFEEQHELSVERTEAENRLKQLVGHPQNFGHNLSPDDHRVVVQQGLVDKLTDDLQQLRERIEARTQAWHATSGALANVEAWLKSGRPGGTTLQVVEVDEPKPHRGEKGLLDQIEARRRRVRELRADLHRIASAPYPSSYAKARMRQAIEALAQRGQPDVSLLIEHDGDIVWPTKRVKVEVLNAQPGAIGFAEIPDMLAIDAWRNKEATIAKLDAEISTECDDPASLSHEARQKAEAETMGDLLDIERQESSLVWSAQAQGLPVEHRADISPLALLGLRLVTTARTTELPETSPGLSWPMLHR